jgi:hypothetical protein
MVPGNHIEQKFFLVEQALAAMNEVNNGSFTRAEKVEGIILLAQALIKEVEIVCAKELEHEQH